VLLLLLLLLLWSQQDRGGELTARSIATKHLTTLNEVVYGTIDLYSTSVSHISFFQRQSRFAFAGAARIIRNAQNVPSSCWEKAAGSSRSRGMAELAPINIPSLVPLRHALPSFWLQHNSPDRAGGGV
jgi:hypothetical protein